MRRLLLWVVVGGVLVVYLSLSWGVLNLGGGQATPEAVQLGGEPGATASPSPAAASKKPGSGSPATPGPTPTPLPAGALAAQGETFVLANAGLVTHDAKVGLTGQGFKPGEPLTITLKGELLGAEREVGRAFANKDGRLENVAFDVPADLPPGRYTVEVTAPKSGKSAQTSFQLTGGQPGLEPDSYSGKPGSKVKFAGGGFQPGERVDVYFDSLNGDPLATVEASQTGTVRLAAVPVPLSQEGQHAFVFVGEQSRAPVRVPYSVTGLSPWITLDNYTPLPQQAVGVSGEDFYPGEQVGIYLNEVSAAPVGVATATAKGTVEAPAALTIPVDLRGQATAIAVGTQSGNRASTEFTIQDFSPVLELTVYAGSPGTSIAFNGSAFAADEIVHVYDGRPEGKHELTSFRTGPNGAFKGAGGFQLPVETPAGKLTMTAVGEKSKVPVSLVFAVQGFQPTLTLNSYSGKAGDTTSFSGSGFIPGETLRAYLGQSQSGQEVASIVVGADGSFKDAGAFVVPYGTPPGQLAITAVGDKSKAPTKVEYTVLPFTPWAGLSSYAGPVGSQVSFLGGSFAPGEIVDVHLGDATGKVIVSATADDEGKFPLTGPFTVPDGGGSVTFTLVGETSKATVAVKYTITQGTPGEAGPANEAPKPQSTPGQSAPAKPAPAQPTPGQPAPAKPEQPTPGPAARPTSAPAR